MQTITLSLKEHKGEERIFAEFPYSEKINDGRVKSISKTPEITVVFHIIAGRILQ
jgi:hypothetical protein